MKTNRVFWKIILSIIVVFPFQGMATTDTLKAHKLSTPSKAQSISSDYDDQMSEIQWVSSSHEFGLLRAEQKMLMLESLVKYSEQHNFLDQKQVKELRQAINNKNIQNVSGHKWESLVETPIRDFCSSRNHLDACNGLLDIRSQVLFPWGR